MINTLRILGIAGSLRGDSFNRRLLEQAQRLAPAGVELRLFDLRQVPFYDGDVEAAGDPDGVQALKSAILEADTLLISTPEYNGTVPGVLQNAIDWASRPHGASVLGEKPVAIVGASPGRGGTARAQVVLRQVLRNTGADVLPTRELLVGRAAAALTGAELGQELTAFLDDLVAQVRPAATEGGERRVA